MDYKEYSIFARKCDRFGHTLFALGIRPADVGWSFNFVTTMVLAKYA